MFLCTNCKTHYYETLDAQAYLQVSDQTINVWRKLGRMPHSGKVGVGYLYTREQLDEGPRNNNYHLRDSHVELKEINHA